MKWAIKLVATSALVAILVGGLTNCKIQTDDPLSSNEVEHSVSFLNNHGIAVLSDVKVKNGETVTESSFEIAEGLLEQGVGYNFARWDYPKDTRIYSDFSFRAIYEVETFNVYFLESDGFSVFETVVVPYYESAVLPSRIPVSLQNSTFIGWADNYKYVTEDRYVFPVFSGADRITYESVNYYAVEDGLVIAETLPEFSQENYDFPSHINGVPVIGIGAGAFAGQTFTNDAITLSFPDTIRFVGFRAFFEVVFEASEIAGTRFPLPISVVEIFDYAYSEVVADGYEFDLPDSIRYIGESAFRGFVIVDFSSESILTLPETLDFLGISAFESFSGTNNIYLPDSLERIPPRSFAATRASNIITSETWRVTEIGPQAFVDSYITSIPKFPNTLKRIGNFAFGGCSSSLRGHYGTELTGERLVLPESIDYIGKYAFYRADNIFEIEMNEGLIEIDISAFAELPYLGGDLIFPKSLELLGIAAFRNSGTEESAVFGDIDFSLSSKLLEIPDYAFYGNISSRSINVGTVSRIGKYAFANNFYAHSISFGVSEFSASNLQIIDEGAFAELSLFSLGNDNSSVEIIIPSSVIFIGSAAFFLEYSHGFTSSVERYIDLSKITSQDLLSELNSNDIMNDIFGRDDLIGTWKITL